MSETANLTIKLPLELKEKIRTLAANNSVSMSAEISSRLERSLQKETESKEPDAAAKTKAPSAAPKEQDAEDIDNQHTQEIIQQPFTAGEVKKLRALLNAGSKKKTKKK